LAKDDGNRDCMHPMAAARWEIATSGRRLARTYGALRGLMKEPAKAEEPTPRLHETLAADHNVKCLCCGRTGRWSWKQWDTRALVRRVRELYIECSGNREETVETRPARALAGADRGPRVLRAA
jgi:hypothetical protein